MTATKTKTTAQERPAVTPLAYNASQAAAALSVSENTLRNLAHSDGFPTIWIGERMIFPVDGLRRWLDAQTK